MKTGILKILSCSDGYVSGQEICDMLKVSRTAVWKNIRQLQEDGYEIQAVRNKGYRLVSAPDHVSREELSRYLDGQWIGSRLVCQEVLDSTNLEAKRQAESGAPHGTLVVADRQEAGRGRMGRSWFSPSGSGLWMSLLLRPRFGPERASMITLVAALAVRDGIREICGFEAGIKWPNDIVGEGKKLCGILTEMGLEESRISYIVVGIGVNVNNETFDEQVQDRAVSLRMLTGQTQRRAALAGAVARAFETRYQMFLEDGDLSGCVQEYNGCLVNCGREVTVLQGRESFRGTALGINPAGELLVRREDGSVETVRSGEVSVRGIYGYV